MVQQKKTTDPREELPELTGKQYAYVMARIGGKNKADSIREATDTTAWSPNSIRVEACKMESNPKVKEWLDHLQLERVKTAEYTLDMYIQQLEEARQICLKSGNMGAMVQAIIAKGKAAGHSPDLVKDITRERTHLQTLKSNLHILGTDKAYEIATEKMGYSHEETVKGLELTPEQIQAAVKSKGNKSKGEAVSRELH